jgi:hypothetical protein
MSSSLRSVIPTTCPVSPHRESITRASTAYYTLLTQFPYLLESAIQHPPPCGWALNTAASLQSVCHKSAAAIDILNHLPYLFPLTFEIAHDIFITDWRADIDVSGSGLPASSLPHAGLEPICQNLPPNVIAPTKRGTVRSLDVDTGLVTTYYYPDPLPKPTDANRATGVAWKKCDTRPLEDLMGD